METEQEQNRLNEAKESRLAVAELVHIESDNNSDKEQTQPVGEENVKVDVVPQQKPQLPKKPTMSRIPIAVRQPEPELEPEQPTKPPPSRIPKLSSSTSAHKLSQPPPSQVSTKMQIPQYRAVVVETTPSNAASNAASNNIATSNNNGLQHHQPQNPPARQSIRTMIVTDI